MIRFSRQLGVLRAGFQSQRVCVQSTVCRKLTTQSELPLITENNVATGVATITLNQPRQRNALSTEMLRLLEAELLLLQSEGCRDIRTVVIKGNGPAFCAGHNLKELMSISEIEDTAEQHSRYLKLFSYCSQVMELISEIPHPVIAAVDGVATAAGCQLVAACDLAVSTRSARFSTPGVDIGLFCSTPSVAISRCVGRKAAMDMLLTGRMVSAEEALQMGLVSQLVQEGESLDDAVKELAEGIASRSGRALAIGKQTFVRHTQMQSLENAYATASLAMAQGMVSHDAQEGIQAFLEKREPTWQHR